MGIIKVRGWQLMLLKIIVLPFLRKCAELLEKKSAQTPEEWDDIAAGAFRTVIDLLGSPEIIQVT